MQVWVVHGVPEGYPIKYHPPQTPTHQPHPIPPHSSKKRKSLQAVDGRDNTCRSHVCLPAYCFLPDRVGTPHLFKTIIKRGKHLIIHPDTFWGLQTHVYWSIEDFCYICFYIYSVWVYISLTYHLAIFVFTPCVETCVSRSKANAPCVQGLLHMLMNVCFSLCTSRWFSDLSKHSNPSLFMVWNPWSQ